MLSLAAPDGVLEEEELEDDDEDEDEEPPEEEVLVEVAAEEEAEVVCETTSDLMPLEMDEVVTQLEVEGSE